MMISVYYTCEGLVQEFELHITLEAAAAWATFALAGPWADPPRRLLDGVDEVPWRSDEGNCPALSDIRPIDIAENPAGFVLGSWWLRGMALARGQLRLTPGGHRGILRRDATGGGSAGLELDLQWPVPGRGADREIRRGSTSDA